MENFELKKNNIDLSEMKKSLNEVDAEYEKKLTEKYPEFIKSGLSAEDFLIKKLKEKLLEPATDIFEDHLNTEMDGIFANPCKNTNRFTDNVVLVNIEDLTEDFKNGKY
jgi:hypothetical protein